MNKITKKIFSLILLINICLIANSQSGSPYSYMGIGNIKNKAFGQSESMGGIGIGLRTNKHINITNPATYSYLDSNMVIYEVGVSGEMNFVKSNGVKETIRGGGIDYFGIAFKTMNRWGMGFGLLNYSEVDYLVKTQQNNVYSGKIDNYYYGEGGLYTIYWGNAVEIIKSKLSVGLNLSYNFGSIKNIKTTVFMEDANAYNSKFYEQNTLYGFTVNGGVQYSFKIEKNKIATIGLTYANKININKKVDIIGGTQYNNENSRKNIKRIVKGELRDTICNIQDEKHKFKLPQTIGLGLSYESKNKFIVGADVIYSDWSKIKSETVFNNQISAHIGAEITPNYNSINSYFKRMQYRLGAYAKQSYLMINGNSINDYGITFGLGLPLKGSSLNLGFELGKRMSSNKNLIQENYGKVTLNMSLLDIWFLKRKYR